MEARYLTDENGKRIGVVLDIEEYERLQEIEDEMEDIQRFDKAMAERERGESDTIPGSRPSTRSKRNGKSSGGVASYEVIVEQGA